MKNYSPRPANRGKFTATTHRHDSPPPAPAPRKPKVVGDPDLWITLQRSSLDGWVKTTRAMNTPAGVLINTCSRKEGAEPLVAEALALIPGTKLLERKIVPA